MTFDDPDFRNCFDRAWERATAGRDGRKIAVNKNRLLELLRDEVRRQAWVVHLREQRKQSA